MKNEREKSDYNEYLEKALNEIRQEFRDSGRMLAVIIYAKHIKEDKCLTNITYFPGVIQNSQILPLLEDMIAWKKRCLAAPSN